MAVQHPNLLFNGHRVCGENYTSPVKGRTHQSDRPPANIGVPPFLLVITQNSEEG